MDRAADCYRKALELDPGCAEAHNNLGNILRVRGELDDAHDCFSRAIEYRQTYAEAYNNRALIRLLQKKQDEALADVRSALALKPAFPAALAMRGSVLVAKGEFDNSIAWFKQAIAVEPRCIEAHNNLGSCLLQLNRVDEAINHYEEAIRLSDENRQAESLFNLGTALVCRNSLDRAIETFGKVLESEPGHLGARNNLGMALQNKGQAEDAVVAYGQALAINPEYAAALSNKLTAMHYVTAYTNADMLKVARDYGAVFGRREIRPIAGRDLAPERKLRVGYVSGDFNAHPVAFYILRCLEAHDRRNFEIYCYSNCADVDSATEEIRRRSDRWREISGITDAEADELIRADEIDILVDLAGHTNKMRLALFGWRPAPIQVAWIGYFGTTGLPTMDYLLLDPISAPTGADEWYSESLVRLPYGRFCYTAPPVNISPSTPPCLANGFVSFGCFNNVTKLSSETIDLWAMLLRALPDARLILKWKTLSEPSVRNRLADMFAAAAVNPERIEFRGGSPYDVMLGQYNDVDIALDPFPFGGATTSCEALWMGVPVITLPGEKLASRQTLGFLHYMGHAELAAASREDYVARAIALARDPERLRQLRRCLRSEMETSPFCDGQKFTTALEAAYRQMWRRYVVGEAPTAFDVAPMEATQ